MGINWDSWVRPGENFVAPVERPTEYRLNRDAFAAAAELFTYLPNEETNEQSSHHDLALVKDRGTDYARITYPGGGWNQRLRTFVERIVLIPAREASGKFYLEAVAKVGRGSLLDVDGNSFGSDGDWKITRWTVEKDHDVETSEAKSVDTIHWRHASGHKVIARYYWNRYIPKGSESSDP